MKKKGNVFIITVIFVALILIIFLFIMAIFIGEVNSLLYNIKLDMYSINKSAIISVNKGITSRERFSYSKDEYEKYFIQMLKANYNLNDELENTSGIVQHVDVLDYKIYDKNKKDEYTNKRLEDTTIHSVIKVKIKPIILQEMLANVFTFEIHEDVALDMVEY